MLELSIRKAVGNFSLDVAWTSREEVVALFGASGAGKSLTLQCLAGLARPDSGRISLDGRVLFDHQGRINVPPQRRHLGYVFQGYALFPHLTVEDNVTFGLAKRSDLERHRRAAELLDRLGLAALAKRKPAELSGGQQQRVALARALAPDPPLLLLDEPLSALDAPLRRQLREDLGALIRSYVRAAVVVTHDLTDAFQLADRIIVYDRGRVVQAGLREEVFANPASEQVARLLGFRNVFRGRAGSVEAGLVSITWPGGVLRSPLPPTQTDRLTAGRELTFFIRPEHIRLVRKDRPRPLNPINLLAGRIVDRVDMGATFALRLAVEGERDSETELLEIDVSRLVYYLLRLDRDELWEVTIQPSAIQLVADPGSPAPGSNCKILT